jgi:hypothetical protein
VNLVELLGGDDGARPAGDGGGFDAAAGVDGDELVVERGGEDRGQDGFEIGDGGRGQALVFELGDPFADVLGGDAGQPHGAERGDQVPLDLVAVALAGGGLELVVGQPGADDIGREGGLGPAQVDADSGGGVGPSSGPERAVFVALTCCSFVART